MAIENPPAFPSSGTVSLNSFSFPGMDLRDYFAGQFLTGAATESVPIEVAHDAGSEEIDAALARHWESVSRAAYIAADAMLAVRAKPSAATPEMQHVAYYDDGAFHWMSGVAPRDCELFAVRAKGGAE